MSGVAETYIVVSLLLAVFSAITALGSSLVLGVGFERLRAGFEVIKKQTGFFSDAIHHLEEKVVDIDKQSVLVTATVERLETKVDVVDKQTSFFSNALHNLELKLEQSSVSHGDAHINTGRSEALTSHAENLLSESPSMVQDVQNTPSPLMGNMFASGDSEQIHFH